MIRAILFDLDGTLLDRDASIKHFITHQYDRFPVELGKIAKNDYISRFIELDCRGYVWKDKVYQTLVREFGIEAISWADLLEDYEINFMHSCIPFVNLLETLEALTKAGYLLGIITNGLGKFQQRTIQGLGIEKYFQTILISEFEGIRKPDAEIFLRALRNLNILPNESVFIGDHPQTDVMGAKRMGMKSIWKRDLGWQAPENPDAIIDGLSELPGIVASW